MRLKPFLQLVRLPNVFTAAADSLAGWLLARGTFDEPERWLSLCGASMAIYAAGTALNDLCDAEIDRLERPNRPLPSGAVSRRVAMALAVALFIVGLGLATFGGRTMGARITALGLVACVVGYDGGLKRTAIGPWVMGACRGLNLALGLSSVPGSGGPIGWLAAAAFGVFVAGITWISRSEVRTGERVGPAFGWAVQNLGLLGLMAVALQASRFPSVSGSGRPPIIPLEGLLVLLSVGFFVNLATGRAVREPVPGLLQAAVKTGVLSLVWLDVGLVAAVRGPAMALGVAALWVPAYVLARWLYST